MIDVLNAINPTLWWMSNVVLGYAFLMLIAFVLSYHMLFDPKTTTAGKFVLRFAIAMLGIIAVIVIDLFIDVHGGLDWLQYPSDIEIWRPTVRIIIHLYVAYSMTSLTTLLYVRKWWPEKLKTVNTELFTDNK